MKIADNSVLIRETAKMRRIMTKEHYDANNLIKIFLATSVKEYFVSDSEKNKNYKLQRKNFFV